MAVMVGEREALCPQCGGSFHFFWSDVAKDSVLRCSTCGLPKGVIPYGLVKPEPQSMLKVKIEDFMGEETSLLSEPQHASRRKGR